MLAKLIEKRGYNVKQAYSGTEAMLYIQANKFYLVLLDLMIPGITGEELATLWIIYILKMWTKFLIDFIWQIKMEIY